jgi:hypothetical protein
MDDLFTRVDLESLLGVRNDNCLSLFMPTAKAGPDVRQNSIRFKNLLAEAEESLSGRGVRSDISDKILDPLRKLVPDNSFWANQSSGFAALCLPESLRTYRLPMECHELVALSDHFHLKPLMRFLQRDCGFYILALSQNRARILHCSRQGVRELEPPDMPRSLAEALKYDDPQRQLQFHTGAPGRGGQRPAMFHGHGVGIDESKDNVLRYSYQVSKGLESVLREEKAPLILATVDYLFPIYRTANTYPYLLEDFVEGNPDELSDEKLMNRARPFAEKLCMEEEEKAISVFQEKAGTGFTSTNAKEVIASAQHGRVDTLLVAADREQWGVVDESRGDVSLHENRIPGSYDLLNFAAIETLLKGGSVFVQPTERMPADLIAAVFRY